MILAGHETTALAIFWSAFLAAAAPAAQARIAAEVRGLDLGPASAGAALQRATLHASGRIRDAAPLPARLLDRSAGRGGRSLRRRRNPSGGPGHHFSLGFAPSPATLGGPGRLRSDAFSRRSAGSAIRIHAIRRWASSLCRGSVRARRGGARAGHTRPDLRAWPCRSAASRSRRCRQHAARTVRSLPSPPKESVSSSEARSHDRKARLGSTAGRIAMKPRMPTATDAAVAAPRAFPTRALSSGSSAADFRDGCRGRPICRDRTEWPCAACRPLRRVSRVLPLALFHWRDERLLRRGRGQGLGPSRKAARGRRCAAPGGARRLDRRRGALGGGGALFQFCRGGDDRSPLARRASL